MKEFNSSILLLTMDGVMRHYLSLYSYTISIIYSIHT